MGPEVGLVCVGRSWLAAEPEPSQQALSLSLTRSPCSTPLLQCIVQHSSAAPGRNQEASGDARNGSCPGETLWVGPGCLGSTPGIQQGIPRDVLGTLLNLGP